MTVHPDREGSIVDSIAVGVGVGEDTDVRSAVRKALGVACAVLPREPRFILLLSTSNYDLPTLLGSARVYTGPVPLIGGTSGPGLMTNAGVITSDNRKCGVAVMAITGAGLEAGVGHAELTTTPRFAGEAAAEAAIASTYSIHGSPRVAIVVSPPGHEEMILAGVASKVGRGVPLFGFTVADENVSGLWSVFSGNYLLPNSVAVAVLYGDFFAGSAFSGGYWPTAASATASDVSGRMIKMLDGRPAADVYSEWLNVESAVLRGSSLRQYAATSPLAVEDQRTHRLLVKEPGTVSSDGGLGFFADVREGDTVRLLTSTPESLVSAVGAAAAEATMRASLQPERVRGAIVAQGAGRVLALRERINEVPLQLRRVLGSAPMIGCGTFGEQSTLADGRPIHNNLSASVLVMGA